MLAGLTGLWIHLPGQVTFYSECWFIINKVNKNKTWCILIPLSSRNITLKSRNYGKTAALSFFIVSVLLQLLTQKYLLWEFTFSLTKMFSDCFIKSIWAFVLLIAQNLKFSIKDFSVIRSFLRIWPTFTEEFLNGKFHFLCSGLTEVTFHLVFADSLNH